MRNSMITVAALTLAVGCGRTDGRRAADSTAARPGDSAAMAAGAGGGATAEMHAADGRTLGTLTLEDAGGGIMLMGSLTGLPPGEHAFHLHTTGQCAPAFDAAGGHWNPTNKEHGTANPKGPHFGDTPDITVGADSAVSIHAVTPGGSLRGENMLLDADGAAIVIHAGKDDNKSQPAGNAGNRIACGVVKAQ